MSRVVVFLLLLVILNLQRFRCDSIRNVVNKEVNSTVDLKNQLVHVKDIIFFINRDSDVLNHYLYAIPESEPHIIRFYTERGIELVYTRREIDAHKIEFDVILNENVKPNETFKMICTITYAFKIVPAMKQRWFDEDQLLKFKANLGFFSPYHTEYHKIDYIIKQQSIVEISRQPSSTTDNTTTFEFFDIEKYYVNHLEVVFINNNPMLVVRTIRRSIDINHFGKVSIKDEVVVENNGPRFVGPYDSTKNAKAATDWFYTHIPAAAENIKFYDVLGNNSQSQVYFFFNYATLKFKSRYPLLGGWMTSYTLYYEVPAHEYLYVTDKYYKLQIRALDYILNDNVVEDAAIEVALPEGARVAKINVPKPLKLHNVDFACPTSFCFFKRPIVVFYGRDLFENYISVVEIDYSFESLYLLRVPLVISFYIQCVFVLVLLAKYFY